MQKRLLILNIIAACLFVLGWILAVVAIALGEWTNTTGTTASTSTTFGAVSVDQRSGLYQTITKECCQVNAAAVPDMGGIICDTANPCATTTYSTAAYCDYRDDELAQVDLGGGSFSCTTVQAGSVMTVLLTLVVMIGGLIVVGLFLGKKIRCGAFAVGMAPIVFCSLLSIILYKVLTYDEIEAWMIGRYSAAQSSNAPFVTVLGDSFSLLVASFVFQLIGLIVAIVRWILRPKKVAPPPPMAPRSIVYAEPYEEEPEIHTPHRTHINRSADSPSNTGSPIRSSSMYQTKLQPLPLCPHDKECAFSENFSHQLEFSHTCRDFYCCDSSAAHRQHWYHPNSKGGGGGAVRPTAPPSSSQVPASRPVQQNPVRDLGTGANNSSANNRSVGTLEPLPAQGRDQGSGLKRTPTWLRPNKPTPGSMEESQNQNQMYRDQSNVGKNRW